MRNIGVAKRLPHPNSSDGDRIKIVFRQIADLKLDPRNPRTHSPRQVRQIARSIESFGFNVPVLIDAGRKVLAGHGRIMACKELGWSEVPTISLEHLSEAQARAFMIADNRLTENSVWDDRLLAEQLKELSVLDLDFSIETTGFEMGEIDLRIEGLTSTAERDQADDLESDYPQDRPSVDRGTCGCWASIAFYARAHLSRAAYANSDGGRKGRFDIHRSALQCPNRRQCQRPRSGSSPRVCDGFGRDEPLRVHQFSGTGALPARRPLGRGLAALCLHGLAPHGGAAELRAEPPIQSSRIFVCG